MNQDSLRSSLRDKLGDDFPAPGNELRFRCPTCHTKGKSRDTTGHLFVNSRREKFNCFRCGWKGPLSYLFTVLGIQSVTRLADWAEVARNMSLFHEGKSQESKATTDNTQEIGYPCAVAHPAYVQDAWYYLTSPKEQGGRGLSPELIAYYGIVAATEGKYVGRVFIPTLHDNKVVYWVARTYMDHEQKYLNPVGVSKVDYVFGLQQARQYDTVIITEGVFSAIAAGPNAVATFGKAVSDNQCRMIEDAGFSRIVVALDGDARKEAIKLALRFTSRGFATYLVNMPKDQDPDSDVDFKSRVQNADLFTFHSTAQYSLLRD